MKKQVTNLRGSQLELSREFRKWKEISGVVDEETAQDNEKNDNERLLSSSGRGSLACGGDTFLLSPFQLEELGKTSFLCVVICTC